MESPSIVYEKLLQESESVNVWKSVVFLIVCLCLTVVSVVYTEHNVKARLESEFASDCKIIKAKIESRLNEQSQFLASCSSFLAASDTVNRIEWEKFIKLEQISNNLTDIQGVGFSMIIPKNQLQVHIQKMRKEGFPGYTVQPFGEREIYTSLVYVEPFHTFGYDMYTEPVRRSAMERARDFDMAVLSDKVILAQKTDRELQSGNLMYIPVYRMSKPTNTVEGRRAAIIGWVYSPYLLNKIVQSIISTWDTIKNDRIQAQVYENDSISSDSVFFSRQPIATKNKNSLPPGSLILPVVFNGKKLEICFSKSDVQPSYFNSKVILVLITGIAISFLLLGLFLSLIKTKSRTAKVARQLISELKECESKFKTVADFCYDWEYWEEGKDGQIIYMSPSCQRISGYRPEEFLSDNLLLKRIVHTGDSKLFEDHFEKVHSIEHFYGNSELDFRIIKKDGSVAYVSHLCTPVFDDKHNYLGKRISIRDITVRRQAEELLRQTEEDLRKVVDEKDKLFSFISNDLRNPFVDFMGLTQTLAEELPSLTMARIQQIAVNIRNSAKNLSRLIDNLLQWPGVQEGLNTFNPEAFQLLPIVNESIAMLLESAKNKAIELTCNIPDNLVVIADRDMVSTIIRELVSNAVRFTSDSGKISISAISNNDGNIEVSIKDTGIGMSQAIVDNLFLSDGKSVRKDTENESDSGLGLLRCKELVEKQGGKIRVESEEGKGSNFYFTIPYKGISDDNTFTNHAVPIDEADNQVKNLKILIAEDDEGSARLIALTVRPFGKEIIIVGTGVEAVETCRNNPDIDLVLMDIQMPVIDGYEATRQIRQFNTDIVIIAQTAYTLTGDWGKSINAGCNDYISKPIMKDQLLNLLQKYFKS